MPQKKEILRACNAIPNKNLMNLINLGAISFEELKEAGLNEDKKEYIERCFEEEEANLWQSATSQNTLESYIKYISKNKLNKHLSEAQEAINSIKDDNAWNNARTVATPSAYRDYMAKYPKGKYISEAQSRINNGAEREYFLNALRSDHNAYSASEIKYKVSNGVVSWNDIQQIMGAEKTIAIQQFQMTTRLPNALAPDSLQDNTTEVYFWGTPGSGKTCALGTIISSVKRSGNLEALQCAGLHYMNLLSLIFVGNNFCILPNSTEVTNIQEMVMKLTDSKNRQHKLTLIDMAGELFKSVYEKEVAGDRLSDESQEVLNKAMSYLKDKRNNKIHFFVVEYGAHNKRWEGLDMSSYLEHMIQYLKNKKVFTKSTVGVYVLVTKCDKINCPKEDRPRLASEYVETNYASFWTTLKRACDDAGIKDLKKLSFSIGEVFANQLCVFDGTDTNKVIDKLLTKTPAIKNRFDWLRK